MDNKINPEELKRAVGKDPASLMASLNAEDRAMLNSLMRDKNARDKLLSSPEAKKLISWLYGGR